MNFLDVDYRNACWLKKDIVHKYERNEAVSGPKECGDNPTPNPTGKFPKIRINSNFPPKIVFEHPGEATPPTSGFVCDTGGMVVICAGTTGYNVTLDLRYHWMMQKRFQGSHLANDEQAEAVNQLVIEKKVDPCLSQTFSFDHLLFLSKNT